MVMRDALLLIIFSAFALFSGWRISRKSLLFGGVYFFLFIYSIFAQIGYRFYPHLSESIKAYFGEEYFLPFYTFNFLSFLSTYFAFSIVHPFLIKRERYGIAKSKNNRLVTLLFRLCLATILAYLSIFYLTHFQSLNYQNAGDEFFAKDEGFFYFIFEIFFKLLAPLCAMSYAQWRLKAHYSEISFLSKGMLLLQVCVLATFLSLIAWRLGSRTDLLAFLMAISFFEIRMGISFKKIAILLITLSLAAAALDYLSKARSGFADPAFDRPFSERIVYNDYYPPAHLLYAAIANHYIEPGKVVSSDACNTLILLKYPYLQYFVTELFNPGLTTRSSSYAFYLFTEGYVFMGMFGFIYNALALITGLSVWFYLQSSRNNYYNLVIFCVIISQCANVARSQSSYFYKDLYMMFLPIFIMFYLSSGLRPSRRHVRSRANLPLRGVKSVFVNENKELSP
jgi:hypothetical protein